MKLKYILLATKEMYSTVPSTNFGLGMFKPNILIYLLIKNGISCGYRCVIHLKFISLLRRDNSGCCFDIVGNMR